MHYHYQIEEGKGQEEHTTEEWSIIEENESEVRIPPISAIMKYPNVTAYSRVK
jgi:hypothetical protein